MTAYTGSVVRSTKFGRQTQLEALVKVSWSANLAAADTLTIADVIPEGQKLGDYDFELFGTVGDSNATPTLAVKVGTETDDDAFIPATVIKQTTQTFLKGTGAAINTAGASTTDDRDIVITVTANAATGVSSGTWYGLLLARLLMK
jgi:hypothetical protein